MSFDMFSNKQNDDMDPNYIYPIPYIDPMMYVNPYGVNGVSGSGYQMDPNMTMGGYMTYMNPCMYNPVMGQNPIEDGEFDFEDMEDNMCMPQDMMPMMPGMQSMPQGMMPMMPGMQGMPQGMMPMMPPGMMMPGMQQMMMPGMMFPCMPMMPPGMMMPGMPQIHMEEFDEEEM
jgi:hypothetical protein